MLVWCSVEIWNPIKTRELVRQVILFESKGFHVGNVVFADFLRVHKVIFSLVNSVSLQKPTLLTGKVSFSLIDPV